MAPNRQPDLKYSSSSDDEEEETSGSEDEQSSGSGSEDEQSSGSGSEEVSDSDTEPKQKQEPKKPVIPSPQATSKPPPPELSSSDTEESGSDDSPLKKTTDPDPNIKPAKKSASEATLKPPPAKTKRPPTAPANDKDAKKAKKITPTDDDSKKQKFKRLWSEDDEIVVLQGIIDCQTEKNSENPVVDLGALHEIIKKSLHVDVTKNQLGEKVRRLKRKYLNNAEKEKKGKERSFSKSHEKEGYDLSKLIWGSTISPERQKTKPQKNNGASWSGTMDVSRFLKYGRMNCSPFMEEEIMKAGLELVEGSKRRELKEKWKKLKMKEFKLYVQRMNMVNEQAALVLEAMNSPGN